MRTIFNGGIRRQLSLLAALLTISPTLRAHNKPVHQDITDLAYHVMLAVKSGTVNPPPPPGVSAAEWTSFLNTMKQVPDRYKTRPTALPNSVMGSCSQAPFYIDSSWAATKPAGSIPYAVSTDFIVGSDCGIRYGYEPGGFYNSVNAAGAFTNARWDYTGTVIGFWAASVDDEFDDTHLWHKPNLAGGQGNVWDTVNDVGNMAIAPVIFPFVCMWELLQGNLDCLGATADAADEANKMDDLNGLIPGVGDISGEDYVGMWHHIKMLGAASDEFDDIQGMLLEDAGAWNEIDPFDLLMLTGADAAGIAVNYGDSKGPKRYQVTGANDGMADTQTRSEGEWQFLTIAHTPFEPIDNLALYGWKIFRDEAPHSLKYLGWPMHALQDAAVPQHVAGTAAWGHRPFEEAYQRTWARLRYLADASAPADENAQRAQAAGILSEAFHYYKFIQQWRSSHPSQPKDIPIRELVTRVAQKTADYAMNRQSSYDWPYNTIISTNFAGNPESAIPYYTSNPNHVMLNQPLINSGTGATLAFLMAASDLF